MITRIELAHLNAGDVVLLRGPEGHSMRGTLTAFGENSLIVGPNTDQTGAWTLRTNLGECGGLFIGWDLEVQVHAPRPKPLYVNHPRTEPVPGDVARDADALSSDLWMACLDYNNDHCWVDPERLVSSGQRMPRPTVRRLHLLVDGETGQVVQ